MTGPETTLLHKKLIELGANSAGEKSILFEFDKEALLRVYRESADTASIGRKIVEQLLIEQEEQINLFKLYSPAERYQYMLKNRPELFKRISLTQISSYLGVARETLTTSLSEFCYS